MEYSLPGADTQRTTVADEASPEPSIRAQIASKITFATHQSDVPVIVDLSVSNPAENELEDLELSLKAEPPIIGERTWTIDRIAGGGECRISDRRVTIAGGMLNELTERVRAELRLELRCKGELIAHLVHPLTALARNEWGGANTMPELLAAFVTPNDPGVQRLLREASEVLQSGGRKGSLEGYQGKSRSRAWEIVSGIWAAVCGRRLTYAEPPASFETDGQKIRLPSTIEQYGLATCLDTALLFAAAIEQAGLHPVIVFTRGHALSGAWLQPQNLPSLTVDDPIEIRKAMDQSELVLFEPTLAVADHPIPFTKAITEARRQISEDREDDFVYAIDIKLARSRGIQPLSTAVETHSAEVSGGGCAGTDALPPLDVPPDLPPFDFEAPVDDRAVTPEERLDKWKRSLLDLSKRNRLLNLRPSQTAIPIFCPDPAQLEDKIAEGKRIRIITPELRRGPDGTVDPELFLLRTGDDTSELFARQALERNEVVANTEPRLLEKGIIELYRKAKADFQEGGSNTLFLALGMLRWRPAAEKKRSYRAPLILLPVKLERSSAASRPYLKAHDDDPVFNMTLLQMLRQEFQVEIPELSSDLPTDEHGVHVRKIWNVVRQKVREVPGFEVVEEVVLSTFSFAKYLMWKDLADRTEVLKDTAFVRHMIDTPREPYQGGANFIEPRDIDRRIDPSDLLAPLNADSSQIVAIHAGGSVGDFVLEGPPGTGKSETIGNIIAHNIGIGRRVLFVSEKMAALDVVYRRLQGCGLGDFCLELHSAKANKRAVIEQLGMAWQKRGVQSVAKWKKMAERLGQIRGQLNKLVEALHAPGPAGISPRDAIGRALRYGEVHRLSLDWERDPTGVGHAPTRESFEALEDVARRLGQQFSQLLPEDFATFAGIERTDWSYAWQGHVAEEARRVRTAIDKLIDRRQSFAERLGIPDAGDDLEETEVLARIAMLVPLCAAVDAGWALEGGSKEAIAKLSTLVAKLHEYRRIRRRLSAEYPDEKIKNLPSDTWSAAREHAATKMWPLRLFARNRLRREMLAQLGVDRTRAGTPENDIERLRELDALQAEMTALEKDLPDRNPWRGIWSDLPSVEEQLSVAQDLREAVIRLSSFGRDLVQTRARLREVLCDGRDLLEAGMPIAAAAAALSAAEQEFRAAFERFSSLVELSSPPRALSHVTDWMQDLAERERRLNLWCAWVRVNREANAAGLSTLVEALRGGSVNPDEAVAALRTAYCRWVAPILIDARPELNRFSAVGHEELIRTFRELDRKVAEITSEFIRATLSGNVPSKDSPISDSGYGVLSRELQKKVRHKPVRQLVGEMGDALLTLTPCLMMSPLSVAQFLPAKQTPFDLVVFDEASQITVPDAIGAIARGKNCIIVGDPRQMPPTRFFEKGADDDNENEDARDLESILDEALAARVPHHRLTGHYRSRHESLICFSNHAYYHGSLVTYPAADTRDTAITLHRVEGVYAKGRSRTNEIEAKALVAELVRRLREPRLQALSYGVVTLNSEQQRLIEDLLDQERRADPELERFFGADEEESVFVKNLETVQGDQRDVIFISIGYGPTEPGIRTMSMNFGPLNRQGGERRLNVAITRATTEVLVFVSFDPGVIDLTRTSARAVADLKHYLEFAARGPVALGEAVRSISVSDFDSDFEMAVAEGVRQRGWTVRTQIGVSKFRIDLGVVHPDAPGKFLAGIECDGATYHSAPSARDRDRVRHIILEQLGWRLFRIWSTDFFLDPEASLASLDARLKAQLETDRAAEAVARAEAERVEPAEEALPDENLWQDNSEEDQEGLGDDILLLPTPPPHALPLGKDTSPAEEPEAWIRVPANPRRNDESTITAPMPVAAPGRFYDPDYRPVIAEMGMKLIDAEGPITFKLLSDRIARAHGFQRTGREIAAKVWAAVRGRRRHTRTPDQHEVFWPSDAEPEAIVAFRGMEIYGTRREWRDVPYPEKLGLVRSIIGRGSTDLARDVAEAIGIARVTKRFKDEIAELRGQIED